MIAALALIESPVIAMGLILHRKPQSQPNNTPRSTPKLSTVIKISILNTSIFFTLRIFIRWLNAQNIRPFRYWEGRSIHQPDFYVILCFFPLKMGISAALRIGELKKSRIFLIAFSILLPVLNVFIAIAFASLFKLDPGNAFYSWSYAPAPPT